MSGSGGSIFYSTSSSSNLSGSQSSLMKSCLSHSTSALFDIIRDPEDCKSLALKSKKAIGFKSANSLFNRLPKIHSTFVGCDRLRPTSPVRRQYSSSIFNIIASTDEESQTQLKYQNKMPFNSNINKSEVIVSKTLSNELEAKPWATRAHNEDEVSFILHLKQLKNR